MGEMDLPVEKPVIIIEDGDASVVLDSRHFPIVVARAVNAFTESLTDYYFLKWRNPLAVRAEELGMKLVVVFDFSKAKAPPASVRRRAGELAKSDMHLKGLLTTVIVVSNPLIRGVVTAVIWVAGSENVKAAFASSVEDALTRCLTELGNAGYAGPAIDPKTYVLPSS